MFSRVLGFAAGRAAASIVQWYHRNFGQQTAPESSNSKQLVDHYLPAALAIAASPMLPLPLRIPATMALAWPIALELGRELTGSHEVELKSFPGGRSLECYLQRSAQSDPFLISPVGTMPYESCFLRP